MTSRIFWPPSCNLIKILHLFFGNVTPWVIHRSLPSCVHRLNIFGNSKSVTSLMNTPFPFRYHGSLTAPPCTENVIWTVFKLPVMITLKQLDDFERVLSRDAQNGSDGSTVTHPRNFRGIQPKNDRIIYENFAGVASGMTRDVAVVKATSITFLLLIWYRIIL